MNLDPRLLRQVRSHRLVLALTITAGFLVGLLTVSQARLLSRVIDRVFLGGAALADVGRLLALLLGAILGRALFSWAAALAANTLAYRAKTALREGLLRHIKALGPLHTGRQRTGELTNLALHGIEALDAYFSQYLPQLFLAALLPLTFLFFVFPLDPLTGLILALTAPLIPLFMALIGGLAQALTRRQWGALSRMSAYFLDILKGLATLKLLGRSRAQAAVIEDISERFRRITMNVLRVTFLSALALELVSTLSTAVVAVEIGLRLLYGRMSFESALFLLLLAPEFYLPLRSLGARFHAGMSGVEAAKRLFEILEMPVENHDRSGALTANAQLLNSLPSAVGGLTALANGSPLHIQFDDVHFAYQEKRSALNGAALDIFPGRKTALVGPSGAGKSTIAGALLGFLQPSQGSIRVNGINLSELDPFAWRAQVAWAPQNPYLFNDTIAANIRLARPDASLEQITWAAQQAHADAFIRQLPQGYQTVVGERAARLSAGQAQRIALARAFLKDAPLVIFDEATANLDPENEALVAEAIDRLAQDRTLLLIAHRLNTVASADQIIVLDEGRVLQSGTHAVLSQQDGLYRRLLSAHNSDAPPEPAHQKVNHPVDTPFPVASFPVLPGAYPPSLSSWDRPGEAGSLAPLWRLLRLIAPLAGWVVLSVLFGFVTVGSSIGLLGASAYIISAAALQPSIAELQVAIVGVRFFGITRGAFRYLERYVSHQVTFRLLARLRLWFYRSLEPLAPARLLGYRAGDLLNRILGDIDSLENFYVRALAPPLTALLVASLAGWYLAGFDARLALVLLAFMLAAGLGIPLLTRRLSSAPGRRLVEGRAELSAGLVDFIQGLPDLLVYDRAGKHLKEIGELSQTFASAGRRLADIDGLQAALVSLLANGGLWALLVLAIPLVRAGQIEGVYLAVLLLVALASFEAILPLPLAAQHLDNNLRAARRLFDLVDAHPEVSDQPQPSLLPKNMVLEIKDLSFRYPVDRVSAGSGAVEQPWALQDVSLFLPPGKRLALVGPSGAGKSTLVHLLARFWEYKHGQICLEGVDLRAIRQSDWRAQIAVVSQSTTLFSASVSDNLRVARPSAGPDEITAAAQNAQLHEFIQSLPKGYDTWIGEHSAQLSAGQRQRLAIARALLQDAPLLILDEPTANLDALTERAVWAALDRLMFGRSALVISHRLLGMETMDEILVLEGGRVVERGSHEGLLQSGNLYRRMWDLQNQLLVE